MSEAKGVKNLGEVLDFGVDLANVGLAVAADNKIDASDLGEIIKRLPALIMDAGAAISDAGEVIPEAKDIDEEEMVQLSARVMAKLEVLDVHAREIVADSMKAVAANIKLAMTIQRAVEAKKAADAIAALPASEAPQA